MSHQLLLSAARFALRPGRGWAALAAGSGGAGVAVAKLFGAGASAFASVSLTHGLLAPALVVAAGAALVVTLGPGVSWRARAGLITCAAVIEVGFAVTLRATGIVTDHYPPTFFLWVAAFVVALLAAPLSLAARLPWWRRAAAVTAVPVCAAAAFVLINDHYSYYPTLGALVGAPSPDMISGARFAAEVVHEAPPTRRSEAGHGQLVIAQIPAGVSNLAHRADSLWLPPAYLDHRRSTLPVLVMLAGTPGSTTAWTDAGFAAATADKFAAAHDGVAPLLVFTDQNGSAFRDTECVDGPLGRSETFLTVDVPRFITQLGVRADPSRWGVVGFSEGGTCALEMALRHPDVYGSFVDLAGDAAPNVGGESRTLRTLYGGDAAAMAEHDPLRWIRTHRMAGVTGWFASGRKDAGHLAVARSLAANALRAGMAVKLAAEPGGHDWGFASVAFRRLFAQITERLGHAALVGGARSPPSMA